MARQDLHWTEAWLRIGIGAVVAAAIHSPVAAGFTIRVNLRAAIVIAVTAIVVTARDPATPKLRRSRRRAL